MDKIANAIGYLALAVMFHGCMSQSVVRVYVDGKQVQSGP